MLAGPFQEAAEGIGDTWNGGQWIDGSQLPRECGHTVDRETVRWGGSSRIRGSHCIAIANCAALHRALLKGERAAVGVGGDKARRRRADEMSPNRKCQKNLKGGYLSAFRLSSSKRLAQRKGVWAPFIHGSQDHGGHARQVHDGRETNRRSKS